MSRNAAKRMFSSLARQLESSSSAIAPGQALLAQRSAVQALGGATASAVSKLPRCPCGRVMCLGHHYSTTTSPALAEPAYAKEGCGSNDLVGRHQTVLKHFPTALSVDDFITRVEIALAGYGFTGDNTIAMSNLCRDESCMVLEDKIESVFGSCFSTHGLGGVLTCGVIGIKAGLSHSPVQGGKERYVFFTFPHIGIDSNGTVGAISRPNRAATSSACGALIACTGDLKKDGLEAASQVPGVHDPLEPEYSILKQRIARRLRHEGADSSKLDLVAVTKAAERTITSDLEFLIEKAVDPKKADYAVFSGVQIHNWAANLDDPSVPSLEFVGVGKSYVVVNGEKTYLDIHQLKVLSTASLSDDASLTASSASGMVQEIPREYLLRRLGGAVGNSHIAGNTSLAWKEYVKTTYAEAHPNAPRMDEKVFQDAAPHTEEGFFSSFNKKK
ncbi:limiting CO2 inducible protein [Haematococcus lacustris]